MSLTEIRNVVLLFSNPVWSGANTIPSTLIRNITALSGSLAYQARINTNLTTLTRTNSQARRGVIQGLLYVPDIPVSNPCYEQQFDIIPRNVTTQAALPPANYNLIALAPWFNTTCTQLYLAAARLDPIRAFIFYRPNNSAREPQGIESPIWDLDDDDAWHVENHFPIFAVPGLDGARMMKALSYYSGNISSVPFSNEIQSQYGPHPKDYIRVWSELSIKDPADLPAMWTWILLVIGCLLFIIAVVSCVMHLSQRRRRISLRNRVRSGQVDLEAMGIKRLTVPPSHVQSFPLFTYSAQPDLASQPPTPISPRLPRSPRSVRGTDRTMSEVVAPSSRTHRPSFTGTISTVATNFQPTCHICLELYEDRISVIRQLPCGHIFHPECIDEFLCRNSSLCPICKECMLPRGYCPKITNNMVRRERAIRRLRERVLIDDSDAEDGEVKRRSWSKRLFARIPATMSPNEVAMIPVTPVKAPRSPRPPDDSPVTPVNNPSTTLSTTSEAAMPSVPENHDHVHPVEVSRQESESSAPAVTSERESSLSRKTASGATRPPPTQPTQLASVSSPKRRRPRALRLRVPQANQSPLSAHQIDGRKSPSALARQRMRALAGSPLDDPDQSLPAWRRVVTKVFPGFT